MGDSTLMKEMGKRIYERRKALKMTQEELAEKMDVSIHMISNLELGKKAIRPENLVKLCSVLDLSADFILTGSHVERAVDTVAEKLVGLSAEELRMVNTLIDYMNQRR